MTFIFKPGKGLYATYSDTNFKQDELIAEFEPFIVKIIQRCNMQTMSKSNEFTVAVKDINGNLGKKAHLRSIHNIPFFKTFNCPDSLLTTKQHRLLEYKLQQEASKIEPEQEFFYPPGLYAVHDQTYVFTLGDRLYFSNADKDNNQTIKQSDFHLKAPEDTFEVLPPFHEIAKKFINFFPGVSEILFYGALLGIVKPFLAQLNFSPDFILAVIGKSGSMKTSLTRRYALWLDTPDAQEETFQSHRHMSDILSNIDNMQGLNFLMDDLHNVYGTQAKNRQNDRLDKLVRHICSNARCANVIITGETINNMAIFSAFDRMFQVTVPQVHPETLQQMKEKINKLPYDFMSDAAAKFTENLMSDYNQVLISIRHFIKQYKPLGFEQPTTRISRHIMILRLVESLYRTYVCNGDESLSCKAEFEASLQKNADYQQKILIHKRKCEEDINYVKAVYECLTEKDKYVKLCTSANEYFIEHPQSSSACLIENNYIFITSQALTTALSTYSNASINIRKVATSLRDAGLLDTDSDALTKKKFGYRHYKINYKLLENAYKAMPDIY